eukprot:CAMPEP_0172177040 /NCGR_PEP_ID=MMETSP1050-20130122/15189_1 /TAXON_ID=233186 /ORGANISM="Cryptomonas curvata, Strain CCAP979/52" /LENGTH=95 /DNA_ID=CAMNT_0012849463 /DNA_START=122 /DNA_END=409 /DNA_ORIENTATION=+
MTLSPEAAAPSPPPPTEQAGALPMPATGRWRALEPVLAARVSIGVPPDPVWAGAGLTARREDRRGGDPAGPSPARTRSKPGQVPLSDSLRPWAAH